MTKKITPAEKAASPATPKQARAPRAAAQPVAVDATTPAKPSKFKLVRDSFTIPAVEYEVIGGLKRRTAMLGQPAKKSEVLRAGLKLLAGMNDAQLTAAMSAVPSIKTGRPKGKKESQPEGGAKKNGAPAAAATSAG